VTYQIVSERRSTGYKVTSPQDIYSALKRYSSSKKEMFLSLTLDGAHQIIRIHIVSIGLVNRTLVHPREVYRTALLDNAVSLVVAHPHPSARHDISRLEPSPEDIEVTRRLREAGQVLGVDLIDHLIIGKAGFFSFVQHGLLDPASLD